jgi:nitrogen-specific signal transduction histidine kinase
VDLPQPSSRSATAATEPFGGSVGVRAGASRLSSPERLRQELAQAQKMDAIAQLAPGLAHELNNPLAAIIAFSQLIRRDPRLPAELQNDAELLVEEAERTRRIVKGLLDFLRRRPPERQLTDVRILVDSVLDLQSDGLTSHGIAVEIAIDRDVPPLPVDRAQIQQVLLNLTMNAIQSLGEGHGGHLTIGARRRGEGADEFVALTIADDGPGVPEELRDRIFTPFFTTRRADDATGLGLPVSADIVAAHGGRLRYEAGADGRGAAFVVELPVHGVTADVPSAVDGRRPVPHRSAPVAPPAARTTRARVLVLDDEPSIRRFLFKALENEGFEPVLAATGQDAIDIVRNGPIDGILSDHRMMGMSGTDVYEAVVAIRPGLRDRFVFMSGDVLDPALRDFAEAHGIPLLAKPFDLESVGRTVRDLVERGAPR